MEEQQGSQQPDFIPVGATPDFIPAEESPKPVTTWSAFKSLMPSGKDLVHAAGFPTSRQEAEEMQQAEASKPRWQKTKEALAAGIPGASFLPAMGKEAWRAAKGTVQGDPMAPVHALSALNPFAAPVVSQMTEQGLGTKEANATGVVGAGTLAAGEVAPRVVPPVIRGAARGANAVLEKAPGTIGAGVGAALAHEVGVPPWVGGGAGYALGRELLPKLRIPGERFGLPKTDQLSLFRNTPKLGNTPLPTDPLAVTNPALPREITPAEAPAPAPLKAKTLAGQNAEVLKRSGIAGPKSTLKPLTEIPKGELTPDPHYDFQHVRSGEQAITQQISSHPLNKLRAIATQRGIKVAPSDTNKALIQKISDSATPEEIEAFDQARVERMHPNYAPSPRNGTPRAEPVTSPALSRARQMQVAGEGMPLKRPATAEEQAWTDAMANFGSREGPPGVEGPPLTPRVPRSDAEMEDLLRRSIQRK